MHKDNVWQLSLSSLTLGHLVELLFLEDSGLLVLSGHPH